MHALVPQKKNPNVSAKTDGKKDTLAHNYPKVKRPENSRNEVSSKGETNRKTGLQLGSQKEDVQKEANYTHAQ